jgi:hypothetical protein
MTNIYTNNPKGFLQTQRTLVSLCVELAIIQMRNESWKRPLV